MTMWQRLVLALLCILTILMFRPDETSAQATSLCEVGVCYSWSISDLYVSPDTDQGDAHRDDFSTLIGTYFDNPSGFLIDEARTLIRFAPLELPPGQSIDTVTGIYVDLWHFGTDLGYVEPIQVRPINENWDEFTVEWPEPDNFAANAFGEGLFAFWDANVAQARTITIDQLDWDAFLNHLSDPNNYGFMLRFANEASPGVAICSRDRAGGPCAGLAGFDGIPRIRIEFTPNQPPPPPTLVAPADNATGVGTTVTLDWNPVIDPDGDAVDYDVYFGEVGNIEQYLFGIVDTEIVSPALVAGTTYQWYVISTDSNDAFGAPSETWTFTTNAGPSVPQYTSPVDSELYTRRPVLLDWEASIDPEGDVVEYDVYLRDVATNTFQSIATAILETEFLTGITQLEPETQYEWYVVARDEVSGIEATGPTWTFSTISARCNDVVEISPVECVGLESIADSLGAENWVTSGTSWFSNDEPCSTNWQGITCSNGAVTQISLQSNGLRGTIPQEIGNFPQLRVLRLGNLDSDSANENIITGGIPPTIGNLTQLTELSISNTEISEALPDTVGNLVNLQRLFLNGNNLQGEIPTTLTGFTNLQELRLNDNQFSGAIPNAIGNLPSLQSLRLFSNSLTGEMPATIGQLSQLRELDFSQNQIGGVIPQEVCNLRYLNRVSLRENSLVGPIPNCLGQMLSIENLDLGSNQLEGRIPRGIANLPVDNLNLDYNELFVPLGSLTSFLQENNPNALQTQTVPPRGVVAQPDFDRNVILVSWEAIVYTYGSGGFEVLYSSDNRNYTPSQTCVTSNKLQTQCTLEEWNSNENLYVAVRTRTDANEFNTNVLHSVRSEPTLVYNRPRPVQVVSPVGAQDLPVKFLEWASEDSGNRTNYEIWIVDRNNQPVANFSYEDEEVCEGFTCMTYAPALPNGNYTWWISGVNPGGRGPWESGVFQVQAELPQTINLLNMQGRKFIADNTFTWDEEVNSLWYRIEVNGTTTAQQPLTFDEWVEWKDVCIDAICSYLLHVPNGNYEWRVSSWGPAGLSPEQAFREFSIEVERPQPPQQIMVEANQGRPTISWANDENAKWYHLNISPIADSFDCGQENCIFDVWYEGIEVCDATICTVSPTIDWLGGTYRIWMQAWGPFGFSSPDGENSMFSWVQGPNLELPTVSAGLPTNLQVTDPSAYNPEFTWVSGSNSTWYHLVVTTEDYTVLHNRWYDASEIECSQPEATCKVVVTELEDQFEVGLYRFYVGAWGPGGLSTGGLRNSGYSEGTFVKPE